MNQEVSLQPTPAQAQEESFAWYVAQTASGSEERMKKLIWERVAAAELKESFKDIIVPMEEVVEMHAGKRRRVKRCFYPGYVLICMQMNTKTWYLVKQTPGVFGFIGGEGGAPAALAQKEIDQILRRITDSHDRPMPKVSFEPGELVRIISGPFADFDAVVDHINTTKASLWVNVTVFGRPTPMELSFKDVTKIN